MRPDGTDPLGAPRPSATRTTSGAATGAPGHRPVRLVLVQPDERIDDVLTRHPGAVPSFGRTLRVALAMRGGVSLAVWIGGAVAELDLLRRIRLYDTDEETLALVPVTPSTVPTPAVLERLGRYAGMLDAAGYDRVEFDLLAGASAGGLNAVVYAVAQRAGTGLERLLQTWGQVGGFWGLLHPPGSGRILALMQGEGYFRFHTLDALTTMYDTTDRHPDLVAPFTSVDLSATVIDASDEFEEDANEGRGHFHFVGSGVHVLDNLVPSRADLDYPGKRDDDLANLSRLALAARSTSSLPGGFEPALIDSFDGDAGRPETPDERGMRFAFAAHRERTGIPYRIVDGAVFDNVPIDRALRAARSRTSDRRADRVMLFLDPEPDPPLGGAVEWDENASRFFRAIGAMLSRQFRRESVAREVAELERFNAARMVDAARLDAAAPLIASAPWTHAARVARREAYVRALGTALGDHLAQAISTPSDWQLPSTLTMRRRYRPIERVDLAGLGPAALRRFAAEAQTDAAVHARSVLALADAANCVLGWARALESVPEEPGSRRGIALPTVRRDAYAALRDALGSRDRLTALVLAESDALAAARRKPGPADFERWFDTWLEASARIETAPHWRELDIAVAMLRRASKEVEKRTAEGGPTPPPTWTASAWRPLAEAPSSLGAVDLPPLYESAGIPAALSHVRYWAIGVDEEPDDPASFRTLATDRWFTLLSRALRTPGTTPSQVAAMVNAASDRVVLDRQSKLAGYGFGNFLGFLARDWRVNDWWWGRLDASAGIARFFAGIAQRPIDAAEEVGHLQDAVLEEADAPDLREVGLSPLDPDLPAGEPDERAARRIRLRAGTDGIVNLDPSYRFAIASRTVRLVDRVVVQPVKQGVAFIAKLLLALVRPALVALPTAFDPPRLALVAGFVAAAAWLITWQPIEDLRLGWVIVAGLVTVALAVVLVGGVIAARRRWDAVVRELDEPLAEAAAGAARRAWGPTLRVGLVAFASLAPLAISLVQANALMTLLCLGVTFVLITVTLRFASSAQRARIPGRDLRTALMIGAFAVLGGVLPIVQLVGGRATGDAIGPLSPGAEWDWLALVLAAAAVSVALTIDWLPIGRTRDELARSRGVNWVTVSLLSAAAGYGAYFMANGAAEGTPDLLREVLRAAAFAVIWANVVWWLPELRTDVPERHDRVDRAPLG